MAQDEGRHRFLSAACLRVLLVENDSDDAEICRRAINKCLANIQVDVAATRQEFNDKLNSSIYDIIVSDYGLGSWTASDALNMVRKKNLDTPFILVTGTLDDERAASCMKDGMADFVLKDRLERLPIAISQSLEKKRLQDEQQSAETALRESEAKFRALADAIPAALFIEQDNLCRYANHAAEDVTGYNQQELLSKSFQQLIHPDSKQAAAEYLAKRDKSPKSLYRFEIMIRPKAAETRWLDVTIGAFAYGGRPATLTTAFDITERKRLDRQTQNDVITGLPNRQDLANIFDLEASRTRRTGHEFSVLVLFLEGIDKISQRHGQLTASQTLRQAARATRHHCRNLDTIGRIAADQFALLLPETNKEGAQVLGHRIVARLSDTSQELPLPCTFAVAGHPGDGETFEEVLKAAAATRQIVTVSQR